ncbi:uncharacterized protein Dvar_71530 [Desulfosarcina variabilis str. Montpellier]
MLISEKIKKVYGKVKFIKFLHKSFINFCHDIIDRGLFGLKPLETHVVICGFPRGGTTLLQAILETNLPGALSFGKELNALDVANFKLRNHPILVTKRPNDIFLIDEIQKYYKDKITSPKFIILVRDPRSILTSFHHSSSNYYVSVDRWRSIYSALVSLKNTKDLFILRFEDLVKETDKIQRELMGFIGCNFINSFRNFYKIIPDKFRTDALNSIRPIDLSTIQKWKNPKHHKKIKSLIEKEMPELCQVLIDLNYEPDNSWSLKYK